MKVFVAILLLALAGAATGVAVVYSGMFNVAATEPHTAFGRWLFSTTMVHSVRNHASAITAPQLTSDMAEQGLGHYEEQCRTCHGAPGNEANHLADGLRPSPPDLSRTIERWRPAEVFWIVKNGVRMTGMPAWGRHYDDETIWQIVAFARELPQMDEASYTQRVRALTSGSETQEDGKEDGQESDAATTINMTGDLRFDPSPVEITAGDSVTWNNTSTVVHTVTADPELAVDADSVELPGGAETFHSGNVEPGETFTRQFTVPGRYRYFCVPHESAGMVAELVVKPNNG